VNHRVIHPGVPQSPAEAARRQYVTAAVTTATPEKLVVLLYDGALQALSRAEHALATGRPQAAGPALGKALAIVWELRASLDWEQGGDIAKNLGSLYGFVSDRIIKANVEQVKEPIGEARSVLAKLKEGWDGIIRAGA
jgi:flagellar protein FliS